MRSTFFAISAALIAPQVALAALSMTEPVVGTICSAGTQCNINWNDDGQAPLLAALGACSVGVFAGSPQQQTQIQSISGSVDVSAASSIQYTPDATAGPNYGAYFIRFTSLNGMDTANQYHLEAFSAMFTLNAMTGTFNSTVQAQISGAASASASATGSAAPSASVSGSPSAAASTPAGSSSGSAAATGSLTTKASASASKTGSIASASGTGKPTPNGASKLASGLGMGAVAVAAALFASVF